MNTPPTEPDLTFHWPAEKGFPFVLFLCVVVSLLMHGATFFLFQVVYPQRVTIPQPAPHVSLLTPSSPENIALLRWVEAEDPALIASDNSLPPPNLVEVHYRPSYTSSRTEPIGAPPEKVQEVLFPPAYDRLMTSETAVRGATPDPTPPSPTVLRFAGALATRPLDKNPPLEGLRLATSPVNPTILLIGVNESGEVRNQILQQGSGESKLDAAAILHLRQLKFSPASQLTWGYATFAWGADAYAGMSPRDPSTPGNP